MKRHSLLFILALAIFVSLSIVVLTPAEVQAAQGYPQVYIVKQGDRLASIARQHCTTWHEIYNMNRGVIGPNPNNIYPGMQLQVIDRCGGHSDVCYNVYDRGPSQHAQGTVHGDRYNVVYGDTWYSISNRFGVPIHKLQYVNGMWNLYAGSVIVIPCLGILPPPPPLPPPPGQAYVSIDNPFPGAILPAMFQANGSGGNLFEGNVVVRAVDQGGYVLAEQATTLQGPNVGTGGSGVWSVSLTVNVATGTNGTIQASSPDDSAFASIAVVFGQGNSGGTVYPLGQCFIDVKSGTTAYNQPNGANVAQFVANGTLNALQRQQVSGMNWYRYEMLIDAAMRTLWSPQNELTGVGGGCT